MTTPFDIRVRCKPISTDLLAARAALLPPELPKPIDEHAIELPADVREGGQLDAVLSHILPTWGNTPGAKTYGKYTTNITYLRAFQHLLKTIPYTSTAAPLRTTPEECAQYRTTVKQLGTDATFFRKYNYVDFKLAETLNVSDEFMGINVVSQCATPVMHAYYPLSVMFMPLVAIFLGSFCSASKTECSTSFWETYICAIYLRLSKHMIGKQIFKFAETPWVVAALLFVWAAYYIFQGYSHYTHVLSFRKHLHQAVDFLSQTHAQIFKASQEWKRMWEPAVPLAAASPLFYRAMRERVRQWDALQERLQIVAHLDHSISFQNLQRIGPALVQLYQIYAQEYELLLSIPDWLEYSGSVREWAQQVQRDNMNYATFIDHRGAAVREKGEGGTMEEKEKGEGGKKEEMQQHVHPMLDAGAVPNDAALDAHYILTGMNASGKSTCMKSVLTNLILTQMVGIGFYKLCHMKPFTHFHLYLNIPDTLDKDSLFQAEARRCREIMDVLETTQQTDARHFCAFDELFTGTNPRDAENITYAYLHYIATHYTHVCFWLTTHFHPVCTRLQEGLSKAGLSNSSSIYCAYMDDANTYKMRPGISTAENATSVLEQLDFPEEMCRQATNANQ